MRCDYTIVQLPFTILVTIHLLSIQHNYFLNYLVKKNCERFRLKFSKTPKMSPSEWLFWGKTQRY